MFGLDLFSIEVTTDVEDDEEQDRGEVGHYTHSTGFQLADRDGGSPDLVQ